MSFSLKRGEYGDELLRRLARGVDGLAEAGAPAAVEVEPSELGGVRR